MSVSVLMLIRCRQPDALFSHEIESALYCNFLSMVYEAPIYTFVLVQQTSHTKAMPVVPKEMGTVLTVIKLILEYLLRSETTENLNT